MTLELYPETPKPNFPAAFKKSFKTLTSEFDAGNEQSRNLRRFPKRNFSFPYDLLNVATEWYVIENFHQIHYGGHKRFWVYFPQKRKWVDEYVGRGRNGALIGAKFWDGATYTNYLTAISNATGMAGRECKVSIPAHPFRRRQKTGPGPSYQERLWDMQGRGCGRGQNSV